MFAADTVSFDSVTAERGVSVAVSEDSNGLLALSGDAGCNDATVTLANNTGSALDVTVETTNFRIDAPGSGTETAFSLAPEAGQTVAFSEGSGTYDTVRFSATATDGSVDVSYARDLQLAGVAQDIYTVEAKHSQRVLEVTDADTAQQGGFVGLNPDQRWRFQYNSDCTFRIKNEATGNVLTSPNDSEAATLEVVPWTGSDNQRWRVQPNDDGTYRIELVADNPTGSDPYVADVNGDSTDDGASVIQYPWKGANSDDNQSWRLRAGTGLATVDNTPSGSASFDDSALSVTAAGRDMWENLDEYGALVEEGVDGDAVARVTVDSLSNGNPQGWAKAGLMFANDASTASAREGDVKVNVTPGHNFEMNWDSNEDGWFDEVAEGGSTAYPCELRIIKNGTTFTGSVSTDGGSTWTELAQTNRSQATTTQDVALIVCSHQRNRPITAQFSDFRVE